MLSLTTDTFSWSSRPISSSAGAIIRQGPHHSAQKSTRTGLSEPITSSWKLSSVTFLVPISVSLEVDKYVGSSHLRLNHPRLGNVSDDEVVRQVVEDRHRGIEQFRLDPAAREDQLQRLGIGRHLAQVADRDLGERGRRAAAGLEVGEDDAIG